MGFNGRHSMNECGRSKIIVDFEKCPIKSYNCGSFLIHLVRNY
jgi:hypothetical protein